uniref:RRM domain-containing protein n=1 Tax=Lactuca sativa TaxID=4236 RepID=A0A9R1XMD1_LACSA|nr:hypothetical protein LSAT_V11C300135720 [Lactuca sativa]
MTFIFPGTNVDDLFPLFDNYGKVVDVFIPKDRRNLTLVVFFCNIEFLKNNASIGRNEHREELLMVERDNDSKFQWQTYVENWGSRATAQFPARSVHLLEV